MVDDRRVRTGVAGVAVVAVLLALPWPAHAAPPSVGISDQEGSTYLDPLLAWTGIAQARIIVPWDVALDDPRHLGDAIGTAHAAGMDILVSFQHRGTEDCVTHSCHLPSESEYRHAIATFRLRWPYVHTFSPWNEANHPGQPTADHPAAAAAYYRIVREVCPGCTVLGAEVVDIPNLGDWLRRFEAATPSVPRLWGLHDYSDVTRLQSTMTDAMLNWVPGEIWLTETGGLVRFLNADGSVRWPYDEQRAARALQYAFDLADAHADRIRRLYIYNWRATPELRWDSGLLSATGQPRPSFGVLAARLRPQAPVPAALRRALPPARVVRRPRYRRRDGRVLATVACPRERGVRCAVTLAVRTTKRRHGAARGLVGERALRIRAGHKRVVALRVPKARRRRIRLGRTRWLRAQLWLGGPRPRQYDVRCRRSPRR
jgi:hypothetical protein